jgi:hypothetical protein
MCKACWISTQKNMEYDDRNGGMVNQDGKHRWYLMMQSMSKLKKEEKTVMPKTLTSQKLCEMHVAQWRVNPILTTYN